jgi:hypothetical protein
MPDSASSIGVKDVHARSGDFLPKQEDTPSNPSILMKSDTA